MASNGIGSVTNGGLGGVGATRGTARAVSGEILAPGSGTGGRGDTSGTAASRRQIINIDGAELDLRATRGTYLDILV